MSEVLIKISSLENGTPAVNTIDFAEGLGIQHKNLLETIRAYKETLDADFGGVAFYSDTFQTAGGPQKREIALLTEDQALFVGALSRNSGQVVKFKSLLIRSFAEARRVASQVQSTTFNPASVSRKDLILMLLESEEKMEQMALENNVLSTEVEHLSERNEELGKENTLLEKVVVSQAKKVAFTDEVLTAKNCHTTTQIAASLGMSAKGLNNLLKKLNVQYKQREQWILKHPYEGKGYTRVDTHPYQNSDGETMTSYNTVWTELGRAFVVKKVKDYRERIANDTVLAANGSQEQIMNNPPTA